MSEEMIATPYVFGHVTECDDASEDGGSLWQAEVQTHGGYGVAATIYGETKEVAQRMAEQAIAAWNTTCLSCGGLNTSCPNGCGRDPATGELNGSAYNPNERLREALVVAVAALGRVNVRCFDRAESPLKPIGDIARDALAETCRLLGDEVYDAIAESALSPLPQGDDT